MQHFFVTPENITGNEIIFPPEISRQVTQVLRYQSGEKVVVRDGTGRECLVALIISGKNVSGKVISFEVKDREPVIYLHLYFALSQRERVEMILQKCTEVGVSEFTPFITSRTLVQEKSKADEKHSRWQAIIREAAEQSERNVLPALSPALLLSETISKPDTGELRILAWEREEHQTIRGALKNSPNQKVSLMIGPEGGFSEEEFDLIEKSGWQPVTLGRRVLRMETAAIVACTLALDSD